MKLKMIICLLALVFVGFAFACKEHDANSKNSLQPQPDTTQNKNS
jgi:hypothetical protein